ncbi:Calcium channel YVC1 [Daldinia childiae]|uniref:Calcium channel YVC1 n=1 Tax=Daldinia childiae TaxID=326645 RepID=UPI00144787EA|nr:Calcium channel YVC1 [Daldinia childiae]KAF3055911.1 Calcium channel YVC1 [Daldinia childiae]
MAAPAKEMLSSLLLRSGQAAQHVNSARFDSNDHTPPPDPTSRDYGQQRRATADFTEADEDEEEEEDDENADDFDLNDRRPGRRLSRPFREPNARRSSASIIPLFSATYLDSIPIYNVVHAIRIIVQARTETTLTWDQIRSPQVSQFLVKPMQQQIRTQHFSRVTLYALMANCLQFAKEGQLYPGNAGTSMTRARVCEILALKLLKEYSTRELIDALSYDFYPLQGAPETPTTHVKSPDSKNRPSVARSSTLEVAIRASAKHFLAHPLVVQQLEAIWNGAISFYSSQDNLHRIMSKPPTPNENAQNGPAGVRTPLLAHQIAKEQLSQLPLHQIPVRRTVNLYDPRQASPLKLSRLRVPRYRQFLSTCSLFALICLFLAVLIERSSRITELELVFWFWSAGFMLDEVVGFNEQGFSLYIMSFWNIFDLGILLLLIVYYCLRVYAVFVVDPHRWNEMAYDVLAANAILLLPRIFSVLDHYRYFSQLLIAFRLMAVDLAAVFILVLISCSGFFVFFTLSSNQNAAPEVAYKIFQILMGFTPAAWDVWPEYTFLGKTLLAAFLIICHFLVVTILITVLTNSFTAIVSNANEEHQFLFAINTISMVKNDAMFSYVAPSNILAWILTPLRYVMSIRQFVILNRTVIKLTHFPLLFCIFIYEKYFLAPSIYEPTDLVEHQGRRKTRGISFTDLASRGTALFSPSMKTREESIAGFQKDRALEEVFRRLPDTGTIRSQRRQERRKTQTAIRNWMEQNDEIGERLSHWPTIDSRRSPSQRRMSMSRDFPRRSRHVSDIRSAASDPADLVSNSGFPGSNVRELNGQIDEQQARYRDQTEADGDDEFVTNDEEEDEMVNASRRGSNASPREHEDYFTSSIDLRREVLVPSSLGSSSHQQSMVVTSPRTSNTPRRQGLHSRTLSTNTILYAPQGPNNFETSPSLISEEPLGASSHLRTSRLATAAESSVPSGTRSPRRIQNRPPLVTRPRPIPARSAPNRSILYNAVPRNRRLSSVDGGISSDIGLDATNEFGAVPSSFATQMAMATGQLKAPNQSSQEREDSDRISRLILARMKNLEENFADAMKEIRARSAAPTAQNSDDEGGWRTGTSGERPSSSKRKSGIKSKSEGSRPGSNREQKDDLETVIPRSHRFKGKGKEVAGTTSAGELEGVPVTEWPKRGSSV